MVKIVTNETPLEELQRKFTAELKVMMKRAALKLGCDVNELCYRVDSQGVVEILKATPNEMIKIRAEEDQVKRIMAIRKMRGLG